jgi:hypothetical protein
MKTERSDIARARGLYWVVLGPTFKKQVNTIVLACDTGQGQWPWRLIGDERLFATSEFIAIGPRVLLPDNLIGNRDAWTPTAAPKEKPAVEVPTLVMEPSKFGMVPRELS